ncbi:MAG: hypothetical protein JNL79_07030 [Myxococcales bacterium]|nr:hypothetical protein [Myxococcales bacterium]
MSDPKRLAEEGPDALQRMLSAAQDDVLREDEQVEVERRLRAAGLLAVSTAVVAGATRKAMVAKLAMAGGALALVVGGVWALRRSPPPAPNASPSPVMVATSPTVEASVSVSASGSASEAAPELEMLDPPSPAASTPKPKALASASAKTDPVTPESEGLLLLRAKRVLREDPAQALALVREHEKRFPDSQLGPERKRILADAQALLAKKNP